jgi:hypothetical protein
MLKKPTDNAPNPTVFNVKRGDTFAKTLEIDLFAHGLATLAGCTARSHIRDGDALVGTFDVLIVGDALLTISASAANTQGWAVKDGYEYDIEVTRADGLVKTVEQSIINVKKDITHD